MTHVIEQDGVYHRRHPSSMAGDFGSHSEAWAQASEDEPKSIKTLGRTPSGIGMAQLRTGSDTNRSSISCSKNH